MFDILNREPYLFPLFFAGMWLFVTTLLAVVGGWFQLQTRYPDQPETPIRRWPMASGQLGPLVHYRSCLVLAACPSGLRIGVWRMFGPFCRNIFVPWRDLKVERLGYSTRLVIGQAGTVDVPLGRLTISNVLESDLASAAGAAWPESGAAIAAPSSWEVARPLLLQWALISIIASAFFALAPRVLGSGAPAVPLAVAILFPTIFFGAVFLVRFLTYLAGRQRGDAK